MADESPRLRTLLEELHGELSRLPAAGADEARRTQLLDLKADVERMLSRNEGENGLGEPVAGSPDEHGDLRGRLQAFVAGFEGAHPQLSSAIEQTANALSNMGL